MPSSMSRLFWISLIGIVWAAQALAQGGATGAISGTVLDPSGAVVAGADVRIVNQDTGALTRTTKTDPNGSFTVPLLPVGNYTVTVESAGFAEGSFANIAVRVTETTRITAQLRTQAVQQKIEVQAQVQAVETSAATTGQAIESRTIRDLPLATQNFQQLLSLSSGAQSELNASAQLGRGNARIFVNGQREDNNNYLIEGISATDYNVAQATNVPLPNPDVVGEFKVQTSLYDASQGRNGGGNVNAILKSGTRNFHGDVYEFFRNDVLNANEYFLNRAGQARPSVKQNIFGGSFGGPIGKEAKLGFFFVNYQGTRQRSGLSPGTFISTTLPVLPSVRDDATLDATLESAFGVPSIDPVIHKLLLFKSSQFGNAPGGYLIPSISGTVGSTGQFIVSKPGSFTDDQFTATWDREFRGGTDKLSARFFFSNAESVLPFGAGGLPLSLGGTLQSSVSSTDLNFPYDLPVNGRFFSINQTHVFSPTLVNDFRFGFVRINNTLGNIPPITASDLGLDRPTNRVTDSIYKFSLFGGSGFQIGPTPPANQSQTQNNYNFVDTVSYVKGAHVLRFGGEYTRVNLDKLFPQVFNGQLFFVNGGGLTDFQKFLMGAPDFSFGGGGVANHKYRTNDFAFFGQDDWKVRRDLTLNLGLRVEALGAFYDQLCHIGNLDPDLARAGKYPFIYGNCVKGLNVTGLNATGSNTTYKNDYATGWGPRVGFAWDVFGHHSTALRGGYGIYYVREDVGSVDQLSFQAPFLPVAFGAGQAGCLGSFFSATVLPGCPDPNPNALPQAGVIDPNFVPCLGILQGFAGNDPNGAATYACNGAGIPSTNIFGLVVPRKFVSPNTQQWNLTLQREFGKDWVLEIGYVGTHAVHLRETRTNLSVDASPANPLQLTDAGGQQFSITANTFANGPARSSAQGINGYSGMQLFADDAYSHYNSLQTTLSRRWGAGYFQAAYTFSRSTDATSSGNTALNTAFNNESSLDASRGLSDFDRTHRFVVSYRYDLPIFKGATGAKGALLNLASGGSVGAGASSGDTHQRIDGYLNPANFTSAPLLYPTQCAGDSNFCTTNFGNLGRNIYRGPFQQNWDFSLLKNFRLSERQSLRFTADFFNIWNHANFGNPANTDIEAYLASPANSPFGKIVSTVGTPRLIQFSLRWAF